MQCGEFSLIGAVFPKKIPQLIAIYQIAIGIGFFTGPQIGAGFIGTGYSFMYVMFLIFSILGGAALIFLLDKETCDVSTAQLAQKTVTISLDYLDEINKYSRILRVKRIFMVNLDGLFVLGFLLLMDSVTVIYFVDYHGLSDEKAGLMFSIPYFGYAVSFIVYPFITHRFHPRTLLFFSLFLTSFTVLLLWGPSKLLSMPDNYQAMVAGMTLGRFCTGFCFASVLPEMA